MKEVVAWVVFNGEMNTKWYQHGCSRDFSSLFTSSSVGAAFSLGMFNCLKVNVVQGQLADRVIKSNIKHGN